jgi:hypothetical protein
VEDDIPGEPAFSFVKVLFVVEELKPLSRKRGVQGFAYKPQDNHPSGDERGSM